MYEICFIWLFPIRIKSHQSRRLNLCLSIFHSFLKVFYSQILMRPVPKTGFPGRFREQGRYRNWELLRRSRLRLNYLLEDGKRPTSNILDRMSSSNPIPKSGESATALKWEKNASNRLWISNRFVSLANGCVWQMREHRAARDKWEMRLHLFQASELSGHTFHCGLSSLLAVDHDLHKISGTQPAHLVLPSWTRRNTSDLPMEQAWIMAYALKIRGQKTTITTVHF